jgi:hypothetical protein
MRWFFYAYHARARWGYVIFLQILGLSKARMLLILQNTASEIREQGVRSITISEQPVFVLIVLDRLASF